MFHDTNAHPFFRYHIKASKTHFHTKMRKRVIELQKVLNRAKEDAPKKEKKTAGGKTFRRG
jgi:actin related protein 2/3 complex subunit 2